MNFLELLDWKLLLLAAMITTFVVSAINTVQSKVASNWLVLIISFIITLLNTTFIEGANFGDWQKIILQILLTMAFSDLFYNYAGKWFLDRFFEFVKTKLIEIFGKNDPPQP